MKKITPTAPVIRFRGFTDVWEQRKLGEMAESFQYGLNAAAKKYDGKNKYIRITDIDELSHEFSQSNLTSPDTDISQADNYRLNEGDILFARTGASVGKTYIYKHSDGRVYYAGFLIRAKLFKEYDSEFVFQNTLISKYKRFIQITSQRSGQPGVNAQEYENYGLMVPSLKEQKGIGNLLANLDNLLTLHQRKLELQKKLKAFFLKNMFPEEGETVPRIRFKGFTGDWEQRKLGDISSVIDPHPSHRAPAETQTGIPFIGIGDVDEAGNIDYSTARIVDEKIYEEHHKRYDLAIPSVGIGRVASLGKVIRLRNDIGKYAVSPTMSIIQFSQEVDVNYMYSCMSSPYFQQQFTAQSSGSTRQSVGIQDLRRFMTPISQNKIEQINIGMFFWKLDSIITHHQRKIDQLQVVKKFMLQNMFI